MLLWHSTEIFSGTLGAELGSEVSAGSTLGTKAGTLGSSSCWDVGGGAVAVVSDYYVKGGIFFMGARKTDNSYDAACLKNYLW